MPTFTFQDIFKSSFLERLDAVSLPDAAIALALAFCLGLFIFLVYKKCYAGVMYAPSFGVTLIALTLITTLLILAVTSNIVLSLGMVGALSIVRFRTAIKEPMDIAFLFWSIAAGIVLAAEAADTVQKDQASEETKDADGAAAQEGKDTAVQAKVRVAFPTQEGMSYIGHSGKVTGYNYDYLEKVSEYTGLEMDYVAYPSDDGNEAVGNAMNDLIEGKVDLMGPMLKTEQAHQRKR